MEFNRDETPTIMDGLVVRWKGKVNYANYPEISASRNGVLISGAWPVMTAAGIEEVHTILDLALNEFVALSSGKVGV
jgi:hypothetical protein